MGLLAGISLTAKKIGIDLGTANIVVWMEGEGIICREPSIVARDIQSGDILAVGNEASQLLNKQPENVVASRPLKAGVIADFETTVAMLKHIIRMTAKYSFQKPYLMICIPSGITTVERRAVIDAGAEAGAKDTFLLEEPFAAATGAGLPIYAPTGNYIVDIGGGTTNIAVISMGGIVASKTISAAGGSMDQAIRAHVAKKYAVAIGPRSAEAIKIASGSANPKEALYYPAQVARGRDLHTGLPRTVTIEATDISLAIQETLAEIISAITSVLEHLPPEIGADVITHGIVLTGGGALIKDIAKVISKSLSLPVAIAADPLDCVVTGIGDNLKHIKQLKKRNTQ